MLPTRPQMEIIRGTSLELYNAGYNIKAPRLKMIKTIKKAQSCAASKKALKYLISEATGVSAMMCA